MLLLLSLASASDPTNACEAGDLPACERLLGDLANSLAREWEAGREPPPWRLSQLLTLQSQVLALHMEAGTLSLDAAVVAGMCRRSVAPACREVPREEDPTVALLEARDAALARWSLPPAWTPWPGMEVTQWAWMGERYLAFGRSAGTARWASHDGAIRTVVAVDACLGPVRVGDTVWVAAGERRSATETACSRLVRYDLDGAVLGSRDLDRPLAGLTPLDDAVLLLDEDGIELRAPDDTLQTAWASPNQAWLLSGSADGEWAAAVEFDDTRVFRRGQAEPVHALERRCTIGGDALYCQGHRAGVDRLDLQTATPAQGDFGRSADGAAEFLVDPDVTDVEAFQCGAALVVDTRVWYARCPAPPEGIVFEPPASQALRGRVVDREGQPVPDADVVARVPTREPLPHPLAMFLVDRAVGHATTDADGRFAIRDLPGVPLQVEVYAEDGTTRLEGVLPLEESPELTLTLAWAKTRAVRVQSDEPVQIGGIPLGEDHLVHLPPASSDRPQLYAVTATSCQQTEDGEICVEPTVWGPTSRLQSFSIESGTPLVPEPWSPPQCRILRQDGSPDPLHPQPWPCNQPPVSLDADRALAMAWSTEQDGSVTLVEANRLTLELEGGELDRVVLRRDGEEPVTLRSGAADGVPAGTWGFETIVGGRRLEGTVQIETGVTTAVLQPTRVVERSLREIQVVDPRGRALSGAMLLFWDPLVGRTGGAPVPFDGRIEIPVDEDGQVWAALYAGGRSLEERPPLVSGTRLRVETAKGKGVRGSLAGTWRAADGRTVDGLEASAVELAPGFFGYTSPRDPQLYILVDRDTLMVLQPPDRVEFLQR